MSQAKHFHDGPPQMKKAPSGGSAARAAASVGARHGWIKRRARRLQRFYGVTRKIAVFDARLDFLTFHGGQS